MFFSVYITEFIDTIGIVGEKEYSNLEELKSKLKSANEPYDKIKGLYRKTLGSEKVNIMRVANFTIEHALGNFLDCKNIFDIPFSEYFKNIGMSPQNIENANTWLEATKSRVLNYLDNYYLKDSSLDMLKRYESHANIIYSESYAQQEENKDGKIMISSILHDIYSKNISIKYSTPINNFFMIPFAIINYLISHNYKIRKCKHCHKYFSISSVKSRRKEYCDRNSPYDGFNHLNCEQAIRNILTKLNRRRESIYKNLYDYPDNQEEFWNECEKYKKAIKKEGSTKNLHDYEIFLKNYKR